MCEELSRARCQCKSPCLAVKQPVSAMLIAFDAMTSSYPAVEHDRLVQEAT